MVWRLTCVHGVTPKGNCADCRKEYKREWREKNKDKVKEYRRKHRQNHREKIKEYQRQWRLKNKEKIRNHNKNYQDRHTEEIKEYQKNYHERHPIIRRVYQMIHNTRRKKENAFPLSSTCEFCPEDHKQTNNLQRHHPDYNYPEIYVTVCASCHHYITLEKEREVVEE